MHNHKGHEGHEGRKCLLKNMPEAFIFYQPFVAFVAFVPFEYYRC